MRTILSLLSFLLVTRGAVAQSLPGPPFAEPAQPPKIVYLLCKGAVWSHENGFGASASTPGATTIRIDPGARKATFQVLILGELQGELKASDEAYSSQAALPRPHLHMGRSITAVELNVNRFTGRASIAYLLADGGQHPAFAGDCLPASPKF